MKYCFYCSMYQFNINRNNNATTENDSHNWNLIDGEICAYEFTEIKDFSFGYLTHTFSYKSDETENETVRNHVYKGFSVTDLPITDTGKEIAIETGKKLAEQILGQKKKFMVISAPEQRCLETCMGIIEGFGKELLFNNNVYVEDSFEQWFSEECGSNENTKSLRNFNKNNMYNTLRESLTENYNCSHNL